MSSSSSRLNSAQYWALNGLAGLALLLVVFSLWLLVGNRTLQAEVRVQQQFINETVQLSRLNSQVIQSLAELAVKTRDDQLGQLLSAQGITFSVNQPAPAQEPASPGPNP